MIKICGSNNFWFVLSIFLRFSLSSLFSHHHFVSIVYRFGFFSPVFVFDIFFFLVGLARASSSFAPYLVHYIWQRAAQNIFFLQFEMLQYTYTISILVFRLCLSSSYFCHVCVCVHACLTWYVHHFAHFFHIHILHMSYI